MLVAAAVCPHPPVLVPGLAGAADPLLALREACVTAVLDLLGIASDVLVLVGAGPRTREHDPAARGSMRGWGVDVPAAASEPAEMALPLSLTVGRWLLESARPSGTGGLPRLVLVEVAWSSSTAQALALGAALSERSTRVSMLVMGDGSARLGERSPGWADPRAPEWDASCAEALGSGDPGVLAALDVTVAAELLTAGLPAWQVLAGAAARAGDWHAQTTAHEAPLGVAYLVASWRPAAGSSSGSG